MFESRRAPFRLPDSSLRMSRNGRLGFFSTGFAITSIGFSAIPITGASAGRFSSELTGLTYGLLRSQA